ncbi:MAG: site-specific DNA-methyltransferase [Deltaproteobacteria bacterium]|nr:site-specific DNA-methyltransferase [Deltaproteobacteria bacterium]
MQKNKNSKSIKSVETITHDEATRKNIPTAEFQSLMHKTEENPIRVAYERRNRDLDPQLVWRGKDEKDWSDLVVNAPPLYIQEKVHPKVLIDGLLRQTEKQEKAEKQQLDLFADFNGLPSEAAKTEFYQHDANWSNRMILGDSLQVMASLAEREGLRGKVQCIYIDPPYGIKFNSNFQWSTTSRDVKDGNVDHITREPEQVKAFRDTWRDGIHSYLTYLRDRLTVARDLLTDSGSVFVQIGDENVHRVRALMDEVLGEENFISQIWFRKKTMPLGANLLEQMGDWIIHYARRKEFIKYSSLLAFSSVESDNHWNIAVFEDGLTRKLSVEELNNHKIVTKMFDPAQLISMSPIGYSAHRVFPVEVDGKSFQPAPGKSWKTDEVGMKRLNHSKRLVYYEEGVRLRYLLRHSDYPMTPISTTWSDTSAPSEMRYVVETSIKPIQRCILMTTDPGDLVLDPTCGSGTTAYVAEQWGRRWITIDTSRVALALARARIMGARYPYYFLADSRDGQVKEGEITGKIPKITQTHNDIRQGFVYERVPHITLKSIANNSEIDVIWDKYQEKLEPLREKLNKELGKKWEEWEIPREAGKAWSQNVNKLHEEWWKYRILRQKEIDASIAAKAEFEYLYDKPYEDKKKVRVAGPFTVDSLSPHRVLGVDENDNIIDKVSEPDYGFGDVYDFTRIILENLKTSGVQQAHKEDRITFTSITPWPGHYICADGRYFEGDNETGTEKRAAVFIGPEFGTVSRPDLVAAAREAGDANFDVLIACAFNYEAHSSEFEKLGRIPVLKARMNADLHMADDLKNTGKGNLFVIFGEPDIDILDDEDDKIRVKINGVDVFHPNTGEVRSDGADGIACWFIDTDYNEESFFVRHAYFLGASDPYKSLKTTLKAEINEEAWATLNSDTSRPFEKPKSGRIAVKVINHLGDEVMKIFRVK